LHKLPEISYVCWPIRTGTAIAILEPGNNSSAPRTKGDATHEAEAPA
jgi:hypothetical protein